MFLTQPLPSSRELDGDQFEFKRIKSKRLSSQTGLKSLGTKITFMPPARSLLIVFHNVYC